MQPDPAFFPLLRRSLLALLVCTFLVALCYFFVDRPVAFFVQDQGINHHDLLKWLTYPPPYLESWAPLVLAGLAVRRAWGPFQKCELTLLAACISLLVALQFKESLKFAFGRTWPDTWTNNNPSLIQNDAYGFHPFKSGKSNWYASFPSGHTARVLAIVAVYWISYPGWRWPELLVRLVGAAATAAVAVGLVGMNYHFVGDVIAGGFLGGLVGTYTAHFCGLGQAPADAFFPCENRRDGDSNTTG